MDCHGARKREYIYKNYKISVIGCIKIYDGSSIDSDAGGRKITDRFYQFLCEPLTSDKNETITCGYTTAREICEHCGLKMPVFFNPFQGSQNLDDHEQTEEQDFDNHERIEGLPTDHHINWAPERKQLHYAIMLFITCFQKSIKPNTKIYRLNKATLERPSTPPPAWLVDGVLDVYNGFNTDLKHIYDTLSQYGEIRNFDFSNLNKHIRDVLKISTNAFYID